MPPESVHLPAVPMDVLAAHPGAVAGADARPVVRPLLALTPPFAGGVRRARGGGPDDRRFPSSVPRWICTNLIDALDEG